jgi:hypothetical protein
MWALSNFVGSRGLDSVYDTLLIDAIVFLMFRYRILNHLYRLIFLLTFCFILLLVELLEICTVVICYFLCRSIWKPPEFLLLEHAVSSSVHPLSMQQLRIVGQIFMKFDINCTHFCANHATYASKEKNIYCTEKRNTHFVSDKHSHGPCGSRDN